VGKEFPEGQMIFATETTFTAIITIYEAKPLPPEAFQVRFVGLS
jgi:hypothetical protein